jgi:hypothetical protein
VQPDPVAQIIDDGRARINSMALSPSGRYIVTGGEDALVKVFGMRPACNFHHSLRICWNFLIQIVAVFIVALRCCHSFVGG